MSVIAARITVAGVILLLAACGLRGVDAAAPDAPGVRVPADELLAAIAEAPYAIRLPALDGYELSHVDYISEPSDPSGHRFSIDVRMVNADGVVMHVWQTNVLPEVMGKTDPVLVDGGTDVSIAGEVWTEVTLPNGDGTSNIQLARRFGDVTLSLDTNDVTLAYEAAASIQNTP